jgi:flagellar assembly protein FliH
MHPGTTLEEANERVLEIVEDAIRESAAIRQRAYQDGYASGERDGRNTARSELLGALGLVSGVANDARRVREAILRDHEREIVDLAIEVARAVLGEAIALDPRSVVATVDRALERAATMNVVRIRVNPADVTHVVAHLAESATTASASWDVTPDGAISVAGCIIDVEGGTIDARLDVQFETVVRALRDLVPPPESDEPRADPDFEVQRAA